MKEVQMFKCDGCGSSYNTERSALECEFNHAKERLANQYLRDGYSLDFINRNCGFNWHLSEELKKVTKDNCFKMSHWQCCEQPAYQITQINYRGDIYLWGIGSYSGGYGNWITMANLKDRKIYPPEELFKYGEA